MNRFALAGTALAGALLLATLSLNLARVDETEHCIRTRYGNIVDEDVAEGLTHTILSELTCFSLTEQNHPSVGGDDAKEIITNAVTRDSLVITSADVAMTWQYVPAQVPQLFREKRSVDKTIFEVQNALRDGWRSAVATVSAETMLTRAGLDTIVRGHVQRKLGDRYEVKKIFIRDITIPQTIADARERIIKQAADLQQARNDSAIAVATGAAKIAAAEAENRVRQLNAQVFNTNQRLVDLEIAKELAKLCGQSTTCVIGASPSSLLGVR